MIDREFLQVDSALLHLPGGRRGGVDPMKLHRQLVRYDLSVTGMPPLEVSRGTDGKMVINDGVTRATRVAKYLPGLLVTVEVTGTVPVAVGGTSCREGAAMTNEETRTELLATLAELGRLHPNWRLGQMLSNLAMAAGHLDAGAVWDLEDEEALAAARQLVESRVASSARSE